MGYIIIGILSILIELTTYRFLLTILNNFYISTFISVLLGIIFAFWLNVSYNFKISTAKRNKALLYFLIISFTSYFIQIFIINKLLQFTSYYYSRIIISGSFFWVAYFFHSKTSFKDYKKVGVAIYANGVEDLSEIFKRVKNFPDFIHIDIVDKTINFNSENVLSYKSEVIKGYWNQKFIEAHIMSKTPKKWIKEIAQNVDRIYIHVDLDEDLHEVLLLIKRNNCEAGIVLQNLSELEVFDKNNKLIDSILVLAIEKPGFSGQKFNNNTFNLIDEINKHKYRGQISLNVDGGVNKSNVSKIRSENVVSGSYVLNAVDPIKNLLILQTSAHYEPK